MKAALAEDPLSRSFRLVYLRRNMAQEATASRDGAAAPAAELAALKLSAEASAATNGHAAEQPDDDNDDDDGEDDAAEPAANGATGARGPASSETYGGKLTLKLIATPFVQTRKRASRLPPALGSWTYS